MSVYWDFSALVEAALEEKTRGILQKDGGVTRAHSFAEVFSTLTGGRLGFRCEAEDAAEICRELAGCLQTLELDTKETLAALQKARRSGVRGGLTHDYLHTVAARKAGAKKIYTLNVDDFRGLRTSLEIQPPTEA